MIKIKQLEWERIKDLYRSNLIDNNRYEIISEDARYYLIYGYSKLDYDHFKDIGIFNSIDAAMEAAQKHCEQFILGFIEQ